MRHAGLTMAPGNCVAVGESRSGSLLPLLSRSRSSMESILEPWPQALLRASTLVCSLRASAM